MPRDATVGNARASTTTTKTSTKGKPLGIPPWGWVIGIALGLIIGYMVLRNRGSSGGSSSDTSSGSGSSPLGNTDSGPGGGASSGSPSQNPVVVSSGLDTQGAGSNPGAVEPQGDSSTSTNPTAFTDVVVPAPSGVGAVAAGFAPNPGYSSAGDVAQRASVASGGTNTAVTAPTAPPPGSNAHIPGAQM